MRSETATGVIARSHCSAIFACARFRGTAVAVAAYAGQGCPLCGSSCSDDRPRESSHYRMICMGRAGVESGWANSRRTHQSAPAQQASASEPHGARYTRPDYGNIAGRVHASWTQPPDDSSLCWTVRAPSARARVGLARLGLWRVFVSWEPHVSSGRSWKPSCGCEWPAARLTTVVLSRTGRPYCDGAEGK